MPIEQATTGLRKWWGFALQGFISRCYKTWPVLLTNKIGSWHFSPSDRMPYIKWKNSETSRSQKIEFATSTCEILNKRQPGTVKRHDHRSEIIRSNEKYI